MDRMKLEDGSYEYKICFKGLPQINIEQSELGVENIYQKLFNGESLTFDLAKYCVCMDFNNKSLGRYTVINKDKFER